MENESAKYHLPLLLTIPIVWIAVLFIGNPELEFLDSNFVIGKVHMAILFTTLLGVKAFFYYAARKYPLAPQMCKFDIGLTCLLVFILLYYFGSYTIEKGLSGDAKALLTLGVGTWMLMQFFMGLNYFLVMFTQAKGNGKSLF